MRPILLALIALFLSCRKDPDVVAGPERTEIAFLLPNGLAYDGCEEMIRLQADSSLNTFTGYRPTLSTLPILQQALNDIPPNPTSLNRMAIVRFFETGKQAVLQCGWGSRTEVPEIEVLEITAP